MISRDTWACPHGPPVIPLQYYHYLPISCTVFNLHNIASLYLYPSIIFWNHSNLTKFDTSAHIKQLLLRSNTHHKMLRGLKNGYNRNTYNIMNNSNIR